MKTVTVDGGSLAISDKRLGNGVKRLAYNTYQIDLDVIYVSGVSGMLNEHGEPFPGNDGKIVRAVESYLRRAEGL